MLRIGEEFFRVRNEESQTQWYYDCANECREWPSEADDDEVFACQRPDLAQEQVHGGGGSRNRDRTGSSMLVKIPIVKSTSECL